MNKNEVPTQAEFGLLRAYLAQQNFSQAWIEEHTDSTKTRGENANSLKLAMRTLT